MSETPSTTFESQRPPVSNRRFTSRAVEETIAAVKGQIADPEIAWLFENCFPNTLDTTVHYREEGGRPDTFVITGDIDAMWLRDSSAQVWPYLPLAKGDEALARLIRGVIRRQARCILLDPYANAFLPDGGRTEWTRDHTDMKPGVHERKWEVDSLCYPIRLAHGYWKQTGDAQAFDAEWERAMDRIVQTFREQQRRDGPGPYHFQRENINPQESQFLGGYGWPTRPNGLISSLFRPSDDATIFPQLIPSNFFAAVSLRHLADIYGALRKPAKAEQAASFAEEVERALHDHARQTPPGFGTIYAYEVNGYGSVSLMDDANVPSLLSLPYLGAVASTDPTYQATRRWVWGESNPFFFAGKFSGVGSPHTGRDMIWPMSLLMRGLTSDSQSEVADCLKTLKATHAGTGFMHESFHKDDPSRFTRSWFAWANTLFGELVLHTAHTFPQVLKAPL
ncbi:MAG: glycoside hydrolase family 125 protein [Armatimonadetes bacterium]|nr:glycoside hydrolase family 125 protein [Armatimonadota bacterium]